MRPRWGCSCGSNMTPGSTSVSNLSGHWLYVEDPCPESVPCMIDEPCIPIGSECGGGHAGNSATSQPHQCGSGEHRLPYRGLRFEGRGGSRAERAGVFRQVGAAMVGRDGATVWVLLGRLITPLCCSLVCLLSAVGASAQAPAPTRFDQDRLRRWELFVRGGAYFTNSIGGPVSGFGVRDPCPSLPCFGRVTPVEVQEEVRYARSGRLFTGLRFALTSADEIEGSYAYSIGLGRKRLAGLPQGPITSPEEAFTMQLPLVQLCPPLATTGPVPSFSHSRNGTGVV